MELRIDLIPDKSETVVCVTGHLSGNKVAQLKKTCDPIEDPFSIDLSDLRYADDEGVSTILAMTDRGAQVHGVSPFIQMLLESPRWEKPSDRINAIMNTAQR